MGRKSQITSYDNPTVGSGFIVNESAFAYDDFGQLVTEYQEHGGAVNTSTSLKVQYAYEDGTDNNVRLTKMTYPDGRELNYDYGSTGSTDDAVSRVASLIDDDGSTHLVDYSYLGRNTFVQTDYPEPDLRYDLAMGAGDDPYDGFDRFGRIVDSRWYDYGSSADVDRIVYGYDRASNRTYREQTCDTNSYHDEVYGYDGVNRLTDFDRGTINANKDAISTLKFAQQWSLDPTGNCSGFKEDSDGDSTWDLDQSRTANKVNEILNITETSGPAWVTPAYNRAGNMTTIPKPADPTSSFAATYDAWNRLVKLEEGANTVAEYVYDGVKRRIVQKSYTSGTLSETRSFYYSPQWQVIEERVGVIVDMQFIWGLRYIDEIILRDRDTDSNSSLDERLYALQDANWNVTALADASGDAQERCAYSAYGTPRVLTPTFATRASSSYAAEVLYAGYRYVQAIGLYHIRHRVYQSPLGCWVQRDPIPFALAESNLYAYTQCDPVVHVDPLGLQDQSGVAPAAPGVSDQDSKDMANCKLFMMNELRADKNTLKCYHDFLTEANKIPDEARREACKLEPTDFKCECCEHAPNMLPPEAHYTNGSIFICANNPSVRSRDTNVMGRIVCHELIHRLQEEPCRVGAVIATEIKNCDEVFVREMEAYYCVGLADGPNGTPNFMVLLQLISASSQTHPACNSRNWRGAVRKAMEWGRKNLKKENCPISYSGPPYQPKR